MTGEQPDSNKPSNRNTETARHTLSERNNMQKPDDISEPHAEAIELNFQSVTELADMQTVSQLAGEIWREHYMSIIGATQIEYMLARFQTAEAIAGQINAGYRYYLAIHQQRALAYFATLPDLENESLHLGKLYVCKRWQRLGLGRRIIAYLEGYCQRHDFHSLWLTVNRQNHQAIDFYLGNGFMNVGNISKDIGAGFVMDDFKMLKTIK